MLSHPCHSVIDGRITVGMVFAEDVTDNTRRFLIGAVWTQAEVLHRIQYAPLNWLEAIAGIRQSTRDDDTHGVI